MADIQDTDLFLVNRNNSTGTFPASELMAEILDDDLMLVNRGGQTYKVTGLEVKDSLGPKEAPPSMTGATLAGTGASFSGQTYTTTLQNYNPGVPEADQTMLAKVTGALSVAGETSPITGTATSPATHIRMWRSSALPSNLQAILDGTVGTEVFGGEDVTDTFLVVVTQPTAVDGDAVWRTNGTATLSLDNGTSVGDGFYDAAGNRLGGSGSYGASEWTSFLFGGTIDEGYRIPLTVAYTVFRLRNSGTIGAATFGADVVKLTLTNRKDLDNGLFVAGDVVTGNDTSAITAPTFTDSQTTGAGDVETFRAEWNADNTSTTAPVLNLNTIGDFVTISIPEAGDFTLSIARISSDVVLNATGDFTSGPSDWTDKAGYTAHTWTFNGPGTMTITSQNANGGMVIQPSTSTFKGVNYDWGYVGPVTVSGASTDVSDVYDENGSLISGKDVTAIKDQSYFNTNTNDSNKSGNKGIYLQPSKNTLEISYSGVTAGTTITVIYGSASVGSSSFSITPVGDVVESGTTPTVTDATKDGLPKETLVLTTTKSSGTVTLTGSNTFVHYIEGWYASNPVTVVSIDSTSPAINVSGGSWSVGQTVKNTVARAPEITPTTDEITGLGSTFIGSQVGIYASSNLDTAPAFGSYLDKGDTTTSWNTNWPSVTYTQTGGTGGTIGFWYSDDAVTWTRNSSTVWGTSGLGGGGVGTEAKRYMAFNADVTGAADGADVGYVAIPDMTGLTVVLTQGTPVLTFATDKDLVQFSANDDVEQDSGYQPITSAITNVATDSISKVKAYYSATRPNNLAEAITGTEYDLTKANTNTVENNHYLTLVCEPGCPTSGQVFKTDQGPLFDMKWTNGGGNFSANGTQLDAASNPPSGPSTTTEVLFSDGGTTGYIVNIQAAYTILPTINLGTVPVVVDAAQGEESVLTLTDDKDLANFRVGDSISVPDTTPQTADVKFALNSPYQDNGDYYLRSGYSDNTGTGGPLGTYTDTISVTDAGVLELNARAYGNIGPVTIELVNATTDGPLTNEGVSGERICPSTVTFGAGGGSMKITWNKTNSTSNHAIYYLYFSGQANSTWQGGIIAGGKTYEVVAAVSAEVTAIGPGNTLTLNKPGFNTGETVTGPVTTPATGTVASTDPAAKTMTLATSDESGTKRWIVDAGKTVVGPTGPATRFDAFLTWSGKQVTGLSTTDPGYAQAPSDLQLQFTDPAPSGQTWDQELPAGTTIQTRVKATNDSGEADSGWSNVVTPRMIPAGADTAGIYAETAARLATFDNRADIHTGELAAENQADLVVELQQAGIDATDLY